MKVIFQSIWDKHQYFGINVDIFGNILCFCRMSIDSFKFRVLYCIWILGNKLNYCRKHKGDKYMENTVKNFIAMHPSFTTGEIADALRTEFPNIGRSTIYHLLKLLCDKGEITRTRKGHFAVSGKKDYSYNLSDTAKAVSSAVQNQYPLVAFQIWELYQMNEFVNHQMAKNTIFVEVENMLDESVFNQLFETYPHVLLNPSANEYYKYAGDETIVVRRLISEAPPGFGEYRQTSIEKLLVDLFGRGITGVIISRSEYRAIYEDAFKKYNINQAKMFRYARRRGIEKPIKEYIQKETNITLEDL